MQRQAVPVAHRRITVDGIDTFYREAGPPDAPVVLLPHGYPCSSFAYRNLMAMLGEQWRLIAPDMPGFGYTATPSADEFGYTFDAHAAFLRSFVDVVGCRGTSCGYGSQFGFRLALSAPERIAGLVIQNGDIEADAFGSTVEDAASLPRSPATRCSARASESHWPGPSAV